MYPLLHVVMYHYIRDLPNTPFPKSKGMHTGEFREQLTTLKARYEMATLESALEFIRGSYSPARDLCLLTFDDGLKEHHSEITSLLVDHGIQGLFFVITSCLEGQYIAPAHMNHFLMAGLDFDTYRCVLLERLDGLNGGSTESRLNPELVRKTYRWDTPEVASFKYLLNFVLEDGVREKVLRDLFEEYIGTVDAFAPTLYVNITEVREMQAAGMIIGGHSHQHKALSSLSDDELTSDLTTCYQVLTANLHEQSFWPFCYPYGKADSFNSTASKRLKRLGFACSFSTEIGSNAPYEDLFALRRLDCKDV